MKRLDSFTDSIDMSLSKLGEIVKDKEAWHACSSHPEHSGPHPQALVSESFCCSVAKSRLTLCDPKGCIAH